MTDTERWRRAAYVLARHLRRAERTPAAAWSQDTLRVLAQLRSIDPARFDRELNNRPAAGRA